MPRTGPRDGGARQSSIVKRSDGRYQAKVSYRNDDGESRRLTVTGRTRDEVQDRLDETRKRLNAGMPARDTAVTVKRMAEVWISSSLEASERKRTTKALYSTMARNHIIPSTLGRKALRDLKPRDVEAWIAEMKRRQKTVKHGEREVQVRALSDSTIRQAYTVLRAILDTAVRDGDMAVNPAARVERPKVEKHEAAHLSPADVRRVLNAAEGSRYKPVFELLVNTGMRRGEALALRWGDVDFKKSLIRVRGTLVRIDGALVVQEPKTKRSRRAIHMSAQTAAILKSVKRRQAADRLKAANQWRGTDFVFTTELGEPCDPRNALRALEAAAKRAKVDGIGLHTLRHTAASVMLSNGVPLKVVSDILGHSSVAITGDIYGHVAPDVSADAMSVLDKALQASRTA